METNHCCSVISVFRFSNSSNDVVMLSTSASDGGVSELRRESIRMIRESIFIISLLMSSLVLSLSAGDPVPEDPEADALDPEDETAAEGSVHFIDSVTARFVLLGTVCAS